MKMSFDFDPYRHIEIVQPDDATGWTIYCHSCGMVSNDTKEIDAPIAVFIRAMAQHVNNSHARTKKDFETWSYL